MNFEYIERIFAISSTAYARISRKNFSKYKIYRDWIFWCLNHSVLQTVEINLNLSEKILDHMTVVFCVHAENYSHMMKTRDSFLIVELMTLYLQRKNFLSSKFLTFVTVLILWSNVKACSSKIESFWNDLLHLQSIIRRIWTRMMNHDEILTSSQDSIISKKNAKNRWHIEKKLLKL